MSINEVRWLSECGSTNAYAIMNQVIENYATSFLFCRIKNATAAV